MYTFRQKYKRVKRNIYTFSWTDKLTMSDRMAMDVKNMFEFFPCTCSCMYISTVVIVCFTVLHAMQFAYPIRWKIVEVIRK